MCHSKSSQIKIANFSIHIFIWRPCKGDLLEFCQNFWSQNTKISGLSCGTVCIILSLEMFDTKQAYVRWTDRQTNTNRHILTLAQYHTIKIVKIGGPIRFSCLQMFFFYFMDFFFLIHMGLQYRLIIQPGQQPGRQPQRQHFSHVI